MENKAGRQEKRKLDSSSRADRIEQALFTTYHKTIWGPFTKAIREYQLVLPGDKVCVCISGGKDSRLRALCFKHLLKRTKFPFEAKFLVRNPGYNDINLQRLLKFRLPLSARISLTLPTVRIRSHAISVRKGDVVLFTGLPKAGDAIRLP